MYGKNHYNIVISLQPIKKKKHQNSIIHISQAIEATQMPIDE